MITKQKTLFTLVLLTTFLCDASPYNKFLTRLSEVLQRSYISSRSRCLAQGGNCPTRQCQCNILEKNLTQLELAQSTKIIADHCDQITGNYPTNTEK
jgi:hypothetical protein